MISDNSQDDFVFFLKPGTIENFWETKDLLERADIQYKVQGELLPDTSFGEFNIKYETEILVPRDNLEKARAICQSIIGSSQAIETGNLDRGKAFLTK